MFKDTERMLRRLGRESTVSVPISDDAEGYYDRECSSEECQFQFKVQSEDWKDKVRDEEVFCPFCGHTAESDEWWTQQQIEHAQAAAIAKFKEQLGKALKSDAARFNRSQPRGGFIAMTMRVNSRPQQMLVPPAASEPMLLKITCPFCACRYAVIGAAYFCPACGHSAAEQVIEQTVTGIKAALDALDTVRAAMPDKDSAETTARLIVENGLQNAVTAFQRLVEVLYERLPATPTARRNAFQNLKEGSTLWQNATSHSYADHLSSADLDSLEQAFQQRHLLVHRQGVVDADYISRSGDTRYREGQRIVVRPENVTDALARIETLITGLRSDVEDSLP